MWRLRGFVQHLMDFKGCLRDIQRVYDLKKPLSDILGIFYATLLSVRET